MNTLKIATHNSGTGEQSYRWYHKLLVPFARCQSKTLAQQWNAGCRYFDLRVRKDSNGEYRICHGIWKSEMLLDFALMELSAYSKKDNEKVYVIITYEGTCNSPYTFMQDMFTRKELYPYSAITFCSINIKKPLWTCLWNSTEHPECVQGFKNLDGSSWHTYIPIPWLWKKLLNNKPEFSSDRFTLVDFL